MTTIMKKKKKRKKDHYFSYSHQKYIKINIGCGSNQNSTNIGADAKFFWVFVLTLSIIKFSKIVKIFSVRAYSMPNISIINCKFYVLNFIFVISLSQKNHRL